MAGAAVVDDDDDAESVASASSRSTAAKRKRGAAGAPKAKAKSSKAATEWGSDASIEEVDEPAPSRARSKRASARAPKSYTLMSDGSDDDEGAGDAGPARGPSILPPAGKRARGGGEVVQPEDDLADKGTKELKAIIVGGGLTLDGCLEKSDLVARAREAQQQAGASSVSAAPLGGSASATAILVPASDDEMETLPLPASGSQSTKKAAAKKGGWSPAAAKKRPARRTGRR